MEDCSQYPAIRVWSRHLRRHLVSGGIILIAGLRETFSSNHSGGLQRYSGEDSKTRGETG